MGIQGYEPGSVGIGTDANSATVHCTTTADELNGIAGADRVPRIASSPQLNLVTSGRCSRSVLSQRVSLCLHCRADQQAREVVAQARSLLPRPPDRRDRVWGESCAPPHVKELSRNLPTKDEKVSPLAVEFGNLRKTAPLYEAKRVEKRDAWSVVREDKPQQGGQPERRRGLK